MSAPATPFRTNADSRLCTRCQSIFKSENTIEDDQQWREHHNNGAGFIEAVESGCYFCTWVWIQFQDIKQEKGPISHTLYRIDQMDQLPSRSYFGVAILVAEVPGETRGFWHYFRGCRSSDNGEYMVFLYIPSLMWTSRPAPIPRLHTAHT
jgi:hypothetical protein